LGEPLDQERREGNNDHGADYRADNAAPVELVRVTDAEYAVEDPVADQGPQQAQPGRGQPRSQPAHVPEGIVRNQGTSYRPGYEAQRQGGQETTQVHRTSIPMPRPILAASAACDMGRSLYATPISPRDKGLRLSVRPKLMGMTRWRRGRLRWAIAGG